MCRRTSHDQPGDGFAVERLKIDADPTTLRRVALSKEDVQAPTPEFVEEIRSNVASFTELTIEERDKAVEDFVNAVAASRDPLKAVSFFEGQYVAGGGTLRTGRSGHPRRDTSGGMTAKAAAAFPYPAPPALAPIADQAFATREQAREWADATGNKDVTNAWDMVANETIKLPEVDQSDDRMTTKRLFSLGRENALPLVPCVQDSVWRELGLLGRLHRDGKALLSLLR